VSLRAAADRPRSDDRGYHHGNLRRELLDAAMRAFASRGTDFTLRELAREVGVTHNAPYRHFKSKAELFAALRAEGFARLATAERRALDRAGPLADARTRVKVLGDAYVRFALEEPLAFRLMLAMPVDDAAGATPARTESFDLLEATLEEGRAAGVVRTDLTARELALASLLASGHLPAGEARVRRYGDTLSTIFFEGARKPPRRRS
jgi:AcrR family transcriptional regulator